MNLFEHLLGTASKADPDRVLLETGDGRTWTYAEVEALSARFAHSLQARGVQPGDRVAVQVEKRPEVLALYLGCLRAGAVYLPLNTAYTRHEVEYILEDARPAVFVRDPLTEPVSAPSTAFPSVPRADSDLAAIVYTSGTTGRPKGAMLSHGNLLSNAEALVRAWRFSREDVLLHALPIYHVHGLFVALHTVLLASASLLWLPRFDAAEVLRLLPRSTVFMGVPTYYVRLLGQPGWDRGAVRSMRLFTSGSAPLSAETHREFELRAGHAILERYGMTETGMNSSNPYEGDRVAGTVGLPLPGVDLRICDPETGQVLALGKAGVIEVRGPNVFSGYWEMPGKTQEEFRDDGYFITGDLGRIDERGYVTILGRDKDLVITGGLNVYPKEVESEVEALPGVMECAVVGVPHPDFGEAVIAVVVRRSPQDVPNVSSRPPTAQDVAGSAANSSHLPQLTAESMLEHLRGRLASFKLPKRIVFVDELPRNSMGKVQKTLLRESCAKLFLP